MIVVHIDSGLDLFDGMFMLNIETTSDIWVPT